MFVVRIEGEERADFKAFEKRPDAQARYDLGSAMVWDGDAKSSALFEVGSTNNPGEAIQAVKDGSGAKVQLLAMQPTDLLNSINLDDIGL